jgi:hypothetical protein
MSRDMMFYAGGLVVGVIVARWDRAFTRAYRHWLRRQAWYRNLKARVES